MLRLLAFAGFTVLMLCGLFLADASAQVKTDGSTGPRVSLTGPNYTIGQNLGTLSGNNLFQSFSTFNLVKGDVATFTGPSTLSNIIARVTGGAASSIDGTIATRTGGTPNLFLLNPAGIMFGPHASLNVEGSFHASTAGQVQFADGSKFVANLGGGSTFTTAAPTAFGFLAPNPAPVSVTGSNLAVPSGRQLSLVGGGVQIKGATVSAPAGKMMIASVAAPGAVPLNPATAPMPGTAPSGSVQIAAGSTVSADADSSALQGGSLYVSGGDLSVVTSTLSASNAGAGPGGLISVAATGNVSLSNGEYSRDSSIGSVASGTGTSAAISVTAQGSLHLLNGSSIATSTVASGWAGNVSVSASEILLNDVNSGFPHFSGTYIGSTSKGSGAGEPGSISILSRGLLSIDAGGPFGLAHISRSNYSVPGSGSINVEASSIVIDGEAFQGEGSAFFAGQTTGIFGTGSDGIGNNIVVNVPGALKLLGGGNISTETSLGPSAAISVRAGSILINDDDTGVGTGILTDSGNASSAQFQNRAGDVVVQSAGPVQMSGDAYISASAFYGGIAGNISVTASSLTATGGGILATGPTYDFDHGLGGLGGSISVKLAGALKLIDGAIISTATGLGQSGSITVNAGSILVNDENASIYSTNSGAGGILTDNSNYLYVQSQDAAGDIVVNSAGPIKLLGSGAISSSGFGNGTPGNISVNATSLVAKGAGAGIFAKGGNNYNMLGLAGATPSPKDLRVTVSGSLQLLDGAQISTATGLGEAATISVSAGRILIEGDGSLFVGPTGIFSDNGASLYGYFGSGGVAPIATLPQPGALSLVSPGNITIRDAEISASDTQYSSYESAPSSLPKAISINAASLDIDNGTIIGNIDPASISVAGSLVLSGGGGINMASGLNITASNIRLEGLPPLNDNAPAQFLAEFISAGQLSITTSGETSVLQGGQILANSSLYISAGALTVEGEGEFEESSDLSPSLIQSSQTANMIVSGAMNLLKSGEIIGSGTLSIRAGSLLMGSGTSIRDFLTPVDFNSGSDLSQVTTPLSIVVENSLIMRGNGVKTALILSRSSSGQYVGFDEGGGGSIDISAGSLTVSDGTIEADNGPTYTYDGKKIVSVTYNPFGSLATGGEINISANGPINLLDGSVISTSTYDAGAAGEINIWDAAGTATISGGSRISSGSLLIPDLRLRSINDVSYSRPHLLYDPNNPPEIAGAAGAVTIQAANLYLNNGQVSTSTIGTGAGGSIAIGIGKSAFLDNSQISTQSLAGGGGTIRISVGDLLFMDNSLITSQVQGGSLNAGDTTVTAETLLMESSQISANASGGRGGNVNVDVGGLLSTPDSAITATSTKGVSGVIAIDSQFSDVSASLANLSGKLAIANQVSYLACAGGFRTESSLVLKGRGSLPADGETPLDLPYSSGTTPSTPMLLPDQSTNSIRSQQRFIPCPLGPNSKAGSAAGYHAWWMTTLNRHAKNTSPNQKLRRAA